VEKEEVVTFRKTSASESSSRNF